MTESPLMLTHILGWITIVTNSDLVFIWLKQEDEHFQIMLTFLLDAVKTIQNCLIIIDQEYCLYYCCSDVRFQNVWRWKSSRRADVFLCIRSADWWDRWPTTGHLWRLQITQSNRPVLILWQIRKPFSCLFHSFLENTQDILLEMLSCLREMLVLSMHLVFFQYQLVASFRTRPAIWQSELRIRTSPLGSHTNGKYHNTLTISIKRHKCRRH